MSKFILAFSKIQQTDEPIEPDTPETSSTDLIVTGADSTESINGTYKLISGNANDLTGKWYKEDGGWYLYCQDPSYPDPWIITTYPNYSGSPWLNPYYNGNTTVTGQWIKGSGLSDSLTVEFATANEPEGAVFKMEGFVSGSTYDNADTANGYYKMVEDPETGTYYKHISESWYIFSEQFSSNGYWVLHSAYSPTLNNFPDMWRRRTILGGLTHPFSLSGVEWTNPTKAVPSPDGDGSMVYSPEGIATSINAEN